MKKLKEFLENNPRTSIMFAALFGILFSVLHEAGQKLLIPMVSFVQPFLLNHNSSFLAEVFVNCAIQGFIAFSVSLIIVPLFVSTLRPQSMSCLFAAVGANLLYSFWWLPLSIYLNQWPVPIEYMSIMYWSSLVTSAIFFGILFWVARKPNAFNQALTSSLMNCPHCKQKVSLFSREMNRFGKVKACPHCAGAVRFSINLKVAALWLVPAVILALVLKPWLGAFNNLPGFITLLVFAAKLEPVAQAR